MKAKPGHIRLIDGKIKFEYYELEKPKKPDFPYDKNDSFGKLGYSLYDMAMRNYEALKRTIEVSNEGYFRKLNINGENRIVFNNQPCKAEVNGTATIIELINEKECPICSRTDNHKHGELN